MPGAAGGPSAGRMGMPGAAGGRSTDRSGRSAGGLSGPGGEVSTALTQDERKLYDYVKARQGGASYVLATDGWTTASPYVLATGDAVLPMGGFSGSVPQPSLSGFTALVHGGRLHYVLLSGSAGFGGMRGGGSGSVASIGTWVRAHCSAVPSSAYGVAVRSTTAASGTAGGPGATGTSGTVERPGGFGGFGGGGGTGSLYRCTTAS